MITAFMRWHIAQKPWPYSCDNQLGTPALLEIIPLIDDATYTVMLTDRELGFMGPPATAEKVGRRGVSCQGGTRLSSGESRRAENV